MVSISSDYGLGTHFGLEAMSMDVSISGLIQPYWYYFFIIPNHCEWWDSRSPEKIKVPPCNACRASEKYICS